jgi:type II secretory pathway component PulF
MLAKALMVVNFLVIPKFASVFSKLGADLPFLTQVLVGTSNFLLTYQLDGLGSTIGYDADTGEISTVIN